MVAADPPGSRASCARHLSGATGETSILNSRPLMISSKRCTFTIASIRWAVRQTARCSLAWRQRQSSEGTDEGASTQCTGIDLSGEPYEKKLWCRYFNNRSTALPHVFHTLAGTRVPRRLTTVAANNNL